MRNAFKASIRQLAADISDWQRRIVETQALIEQLSARAERGTDGIHRTAPAAHEKPARKRRRRRRNSSRTSGTVPRRNAQARRRKRPKPDVVESVQVAAPEPRPAVAKAKIRGAEQFASQLAELDKIRAGIEAGGQDSKSAHKLRVRGNAVLKELKGRAKLPAWLDKAERMRWRRASKGPGWKPKRPPTPPPVPPVKRDSGWHDDGNGNLVREIASQ